MWMTWDDWMVTTQDDMETFFFSGIRKFLLLVFALDLAPVAY